MKGLFTLIFLLTFLSCNAQTITCDQAKDSIGKYVTVCGQVMGTHYEAKSKGQPTFINLCAPYPNSPFTIVVWNDVKMDYKIESLKGKTICVTGGIKDYTGKPEIEISEQSQIEISK